MAGFVRAVRRAAVFFVAIASGSFGLVIIWFLVRPGVIAQVATVQMMIVLGLFLLPAATLAAWFMDRRAIAEAPASEGATPIDAPPVASVGAPRLAHAEHGARVARHGVEPRRHRRTVGAGDAA